MEHPEPTPSPTPPPALARWRCVLAVALVVGVVGGIAYLATPSGPRGVVGGEPEWVFSLTANGNGVGSNLAQERLLVSAHPYFLAPAPGIGPSNANPRFVRVAQYSVRFAGPGQWCTYHLPDVMREDPVDYERLSGILNRHLPGRRHPQWEIQEGARGIAPGIIYLRASLVPVFSSIERPEPREGQTDHGPFLHPTQREIRLTARGGKFGDSGEVVARRVEELMEDGVPWLEELGFLWAKEDAPGLREMEYWPRAKETQQGREAEGDASCRTVMAERLEGSPIYQLLSRGAGFSPPAPPFGDGPGG